MLMVMLFPEMHQSVAQVCQTIIFADQDLDAAAGLTLSNTDLRGLHLLS
jgi:hypothetical protein